MLAAQEAPNKKPSLRSWKARNKLVEQWMPLVHHVVGKLWRYSSVRRMGNEDAIQVGMMALIRAAELWDPRHGVLFNTYAFTSICRRVLYTASQNGTVRLSVKFRGVPQKKTVSLDAFDEINLVELGRENDGIQDVELSEECQLVLDLMRPREREMVVAYFLEGGTLNSVGEKFGVCKERVRQIMKRGYERVRHLLNDHGE